MRAYTLKVESKVHAVISNGPVYDTIKDRMAKSHFESSLENLLLHLH